MTNEQRAAIVAFVSPKGGAGKSTSCLNLASAMAKRGYKTRIVDFDQTETLWRWYTRNPAAQTLPNLSVIKGPVHGAPEVIGKYIDSLWHVSDVDFIFIDLAGSLSRAVLVLATAADLIITPAKLFEPDVAEAEKLFQELDELAVKMQKPLIHRLLINEVPIFPFGKLPRAQSFALDMIDQSTLPRFKTLVHVRAIFGDTWLNGLPPHFGDQTNMQIRKAVGEIDLVADELLDTFNTQQEREAA